MDPDEVRFGLYMPNFGTAAHPKTVADLAETAEDNGWDGLYLWDHLVLWDKRVPIYDSFTSLAAAAMRTEYLRLGTTVSPLAKSKPWILARQTMSLDHLSNGRFTLGVGLGIEETVDYDRWGEKADEKVLAEKLDESLDILAGLWSGKTFRYSGKQYTVKKKTVFLPSSVQKPRIPVWAAGYWPRKAQFRRAGRWDGVIPLRSPGELPSPTDVREIVAFIAKTRKTKGRFDIANIGWTTGKNRRRDKEKVASFRQAGATWWLESLYTKQDSPRKMRARIKQGPPS